MGCLGEAGKLITTIFTLIGLLIGSVVEIFQAIGESNSQSREADRISQSVIECFVDEDEKELKKLFCEKIAGKYTLDKEIQNAFDYIDGEIISYNVYSDPIGGSAWDDGVQTRLDVKPWIREIKTDTGGEYTIAAHGYLVYEKGGEYIGLTYINIRDENRGPTEICTIGEYIY